MATSTLGAQINPCRTVPWLPVSGNLSDKARPEFGRRDGCFSCLTFGDWQADESHCRHGTSSSSDHSALSPPLDLVTDSRHQSDSCHPPTVQDPPWNQFSCMATLATFEAVGF